MKKLQLKESIEASVGQLIQFLLDEKDELLEKLDSEEQTALSIVENNIQKLENLITEMEKEITEIQGNLSQPSFEVFLYFLFQFVVSHAHLSIVHNIYACYIKYMLKVYTSAMLTFVDLTD